MGRYIVPGDDVSGKDSAGGGGTPSTNSSGGNGERPEEGVRSPFVGQITVTNPKKYLA